MRREDKFTIKKTLDDVQNILDIVEKGALLSMASSEDTFRCSKMAIEGGIQLHDLETNAARYTARLSMFPTPLPLANYAGMGCCHFCVPEQHKIRLADESCRTLASVRPCSHVQEAFSFEGRSLVPAAALGVLCSCLESSGSGWNIPVAGSNLVGVVLQHFGAKICSLDTNRLPTQFFSGVCIGFHLR